MLESHKISTHNHKRIVTAIESIRTQDIEFDKSGIWICVGSTVTNMTDTESDIDLLLFTKSTCEFRKFSNKNSLISACRVPVQMLLDDASTGKYGGYFAAKLFNPHMVVENTENGALKEKVTQAAAIYFAPFISYHIAEQSKLFFRSPDYNRLTALALVSFFDLNPYFEGWWIRLWDSKKYDGIWDFTVQQFKEALRSAGAIVNSEGLHLQAIQEDIMTIGSKREYDFTAFERGVNHWGFGVLTHQSDFTYLDWASAKAKYNIDKRGGYNGDIYKSMINYIYNQAGY